MLPMIASLMMYNRPELEDAHNTYWALIRNHLADAGIESPASLSQDDEEFSVWKHPALVLSQTCGMPYRLFLHGKVHLVGTPDFALDGCPPGYYNSAIIIHRDNRGSPLQAFANEVFAYNQTISQSGYAAILNHASAQGITFTNPAQTHSHLLSAQAVAEKRAAIASIDAVTWRLIQRYESFVSELTVLDWTEPTPGLPYVTAITQNPTTVFNAVKAAIDELPQAARERLGITDLVDIPDEKYLSIPNPGA
jgi:ABC-type phosphate/phosphonate transport system substrate-binding protein